MRNRTFLFRYNHDLIDAVDRLDVVKVTELLDQGASPNTATWTNGFGTEWHEIRGYWIPVLAKARSTVRYAKPNSIQFVGASQIVNILMAKGAPDLPFDDW